jgi:hypothetical protein
MYLAYVQFATVFDKKINVETPYAVIGKDSEDIYQKATKYGTDPYFVTGMFELNKDW